MRGEVGLEIGSTLRSMRKRDGLSQEDVAERLGITREHYNRIERGTKFPSLRLLRKISSLTGVSLDTLGSPRLPVASERTPEMQPSPEIRRLIHVTQSMSAKQVRLLIQLALNLKGR